MRRGELAEHIRAFSREPTAALLLIGLLALGVRLVYVSQIRSSPLFEVPVVDAGTYVSAARQLASGAWLGPSEPFWQPPLYAYFLAAVFALAGGEQLLVPRLVQALLGTGICLLTYGVGRAVFTPRVALAAALGAALYGPLIYFGGELLPVISAVFVDLLVLWLLLRRPGCPGPGRALACGLLLGLAALCVGNVLLFVPLLGAWAWFRCRESGHTRSAAARPALLAALGSVLVLAPVTVRNRVVGGDTVLLSHNTGINFFIGNNADYDRTVAVRPGRDWLELVDRPKREAGLERPSERSLWFLARAGDYILEHPLDWSLLTVRKIYQFLAGQERPRNLDPYLAREDSSVLHVLLWEWGVAFPFGLLAPAALIGLFLHVRAAWHRPESRAVAICTAMYSLSVVAFFVTARYRLPVVPLLLLYAAFGVVEVVVRAGLWRTVIPVFLALGVALNAGVGSSPHTPSAQHHFWLGYAYERQGQGTLAAREYREVLRQEPDHGAALLALAGLRVGAQEYSESIRLYRQFIVRYPEEADTGLRLLADTFLRAERHSEAAHAYAHLALAHPEEAAIEGRLGYARLMAGDPAGAEAAWLRTLVLRPDSTAVRLQLARLYETLEQPEQAIRQLRTAVRDEPQQTDYLLQLARLLVAQAERGRPSVWLDPEPSVTEAEGLLRQAQALDPELTKAFWDLGLLLSRLHRFEEATTRFERVLELDPDRYEAHECLGNLYLRLGREAEAASHLESYGRMRRFHEVDRIARESLQEQVESVLQRMGAGPRPPQ